LREPAAALLQFVDNVVQVAARTGDASSLVTTAVSPDTSAFIIFASSWRPFVDLPDTFSGMTRLHPASSTCVA
jgi:hypothetical protein